MRDPVKERVSEALHSGIVREIAAEKAAALGRAGRRLENALSRLAATSSDTAHDSDRRERVMEASEALYYYIVQREACGLRDAAEVFREFAVPREVIARMGTGSAPRERASPPTTRPARPGQKGSDVSD